MFTVLTIVVVWLATAALLGVAWSLVARSLRRRPLPPPQAPSPPGPRGRISSERTSRPAPRLPRQRGKRG